MQIVRKKKRKRKTGHIVNPRAEEQNGPDRESGGKGVIEPGYPYPSITINTHSPCPQKSGGKRQYKCAVKCRIRVEMMMFFFGRGKRKREERWEVGAYPHN